MSSPTMEAASFTLLCVGGSTAALVGVVANALLASLFLTQAQYRHSPFFFLGFVALFDTILDLSFIPLLAIPGCIPEWAAWRRHPWLLLAWGVGRLGSVCCLVLASIERFFMAKHWTFAGFSRKTRWLMLAALVPATVAVKSVPTESSSRLSHLLNTLAITATFTALMVLNGGIVLMLRRQNVQQLRQLLSELAVGRDATALRRRNLRAATRSLLVILAAFSVSNLLHFLLTLADFFESEHFSDPTVNLFVHDVASVLSVAGNVIRCPAHYFSDSELRTQMKELICPPTPKEKDGFLELPPAPILEERRQSLASPWVSLLMTVHDENQTSTAALLDRCYAKRNSSVIIC